MRFLGVAIALAACSSSAPGGPDATTSSDGAAALTCGTSVASYCMASRCDPTLAAAEQDKTLCPASLAVCGSYTVITQAGIDTATSLYYMGDQLVAIDHTLLPGRVTCTAGPSTFSPPSCGPGATQLPACSQ
ncbi:MAG TPA: hypothetical protein VF469_38470 [Kofleriaceae bacterium]